MEKFWERADLVVGGRGGVWRASPQGGQFFVEATPLTTQWHPLALEYEQSSDEIAVSLLRGGVVIADLNRDDWRSVDSGLSDREVWSLGFNAHESTWFAGTQPTEIWRLDRHQDSWAMASDLKPAAQPHWHFPVPPNIAHVRALAFDPTDSQRWYAGIEVGGVVVTEDAGRSWRSLDEVGRDVHRILPLHGQASHAVLVSTGDDTPPYRRGGGYGPYISRDGKSWAQWVDGLAHRVYAEDAVVQHPLDADKVILVTADGVPPDWAGFGDGSAYWLSPKTSVRASGADVRIHLGSIASGQWQPFMRGLPNELFDMVWAFDVRRVGDGVLGVFATTAGAFYAADLTDLQTAQWQLLPLKVPTDLVSHVRIILSR